MSTTESWNEGLRSRKREPLPTFFPGISVKSNDISKDLCIEFLISIHALLLRHLGDGDRACDRVVARTTCMMMFEFLHFKPRSELVSEGRPMFHEYNKRYKYLTETLRELQLKGAII